MYEEVLRLLLPLIIMIVLLIITDGVFSALKWLAETIADWLGDE